MGLGTYMGAQIDAEKKAETARLLRELGQGVEVPEEQKPVVFNRLEGMAEGQTPAAVQPELNKIQQLAGRQQPSAEQTSFTPAMTQQAPQPKFRPLTEEEKVGRVMELAQINPAMAQVWSAQDTAKQNRLMKLEDEASRRAWQEEQNRLNREGRMDLARFSAGIAAANRTPASEKPLTEFQGKSVTFGTRAAQSHNILNALEDQVNPLSVAASRKGGMLVNWALDPQTRQVEQAQRDFINSVLRQESGAAISPSEYESAARQYFPEPNDPPEVIAQKRANREMQIKGFARQAGPAGAPDIINVYNTPYALPPSKEQKPASRGRLGAQSTTPPNTQVKFLGFE